MRTVVWLPSLGILGFCLLVLAVSRAVPESDSLPNPFPSPERAATKQSNSSDGLERRFVRRRGMKTSRLEIREANAIHSALSPEQIEAKRSELVRAIEVAAQIPDLQQRDEALSSLLCQWAEINPRDALDLALHSCREGTGGPLFENLIQQWAAADFFTARDWVMQLPSGEQRDRMSARLAFIQAQESPEEAARWVVAEIPSGVEQEEAAISVLHQWALRDMSAAANWVALFPPGPFRLRAESELQGLAQYQTPWFSENAR